MPARPMTDVVVLLPGITGSVLAKDGKDVWAISPGTAWRALASFGHSITGLELKGDGTEDDGVTAPRLMPDLHLVPGLWKIDGYGKVSRYLRSTFDLKPGQNFFEYPYDWRRDNRLIAKRLKDDSDRWLSNWRKQQPDAKLILIAHSMGGLVSRYFIECLGGWRDTRKLITFAAPYRGSLNALGFIVQGMRHGVGPVTLLDMSNLLRSFPSVYQLLPIYPCYRPGPGEAMIRPSEAVGVPHLDVERAKAADAFHREIEHAVERHVDDDEYMRDRYKIHPLIGTFQATSQSAIRKGDSVELLKEYGGEDRDGDGTVPRDSATPMELKEEEGAMFAAERHASLQNLDAALVQVAGLLTGRDTSGFRAPGVPVGLDLEDGYETGEPVPMSVRCGDAGSAVVAVITDTEHGTEHGRVEAPAGDGWRPIEFPPLQPGTYRVSVSGGPMIGSATDLFVVYDPTPSG